MTKNLVVAGNDNNDNNISSENSNSILDKIFKNGPSEVCGRQRLKI